MAKCLWRKVQDLRLTCECYESEEVRLHIRMFLALAFLKPDSVLNGWLEIYSQVPNNPNCLSFFTIS